MEQNTTTKIYDCLVIGGGISGVSFAYYLTKKRHSVLILEKEQELGGCIHSMKLKEDPFFWSELGAHSCYNSYTSLIDLIKETGNEERILPLNSLSYVLYNHRIRSISSDMNVFAMGLNCWKYFFSDKRGKTAREYFEPIVGRSNYERLFSKLFRAVISQEADDYPAEIFLKKRATKDKTVSRKFSYQGGLSQMVVDVAKASKIDAVTDSQVITIERDKDGIFCAKTQNGKEYYARRIALATESQNASKFLLQLKQQEASDLLKTIRPSESIAINLCIEKNKLPLKKVAGIIPVTDDFFSAVSRDAVENEDWRSFTFHFPESKVLPMERLKTIFSVLNIQDEQVARTEVYRHSLPAVRLEHLGLEGRMQKMLAGSDISLLGNFFLGMSLEDCVRHAKAEAERLSD